MSTDTRATRTTELATRWALRLQGPDFTAAETAALQRWLLADPAHADALNEAWYIVTAVDALTPDKRAAMLADIFAEPEEPLSQAQSAEVEALAEPARTKPRWRRYALAASVLFATLLGALWVTASREGWLPQTYQTGARELRTATLPDGSVVHLNARTTIRWSGFSRERRTQLVSGQALFQVVHDPAHPFYVQTDGGLVRVLGTKFDLNRRSDAIILTVLEGAVAVVNRGKHGAGAQHRIVYANQRLAYGSAGPIDDVRQVDASKAVRWRQFSLELESELLSAVIEDLSRYTDQPILLGDDRLKTQRVVGTLQVRDIREALHDLEDISPVVVREDGTAFVLDLRASNLPSRQ